MPFSDKRILVVEDDDLLRKVVMDQLSEQYVAIPASNGKEAIEKIEVQKPDFIVLDLLLPLLDGFGVLEWLRSMPDPKIAKTPVLVVSNLADQASIAKAQKFGILEYYTKADISLGVLINRINRFITKGA